MDDNKSKDELLEENQRLRAELEVLRNAQVLFQAVLDNAPILISAKEKSCEVVDIYLISLNQLNKLFPENTGDFRPAFDWREYSLSVLGGLIKNEAMIRAMGFSNEDEAALLKAINEPTPKGYTVRYGYSYQATLPLKTYVMLRNLPMEHKESVSKACADELTRMINEASR